MRRTALIAIVAGFLAAAAAAASAPSAPPPLELERLPAGALPGVQVRGHFRVPGLGETRFARRLIVTGSGARRVALLVARGRRGELCYAGVAGRDRTALFRCLARWDRPPLILLAGAGGNRKPVNHWLSVIGLVRSEVKEVVVQRQWGGDPLLRPRVISWPGFPWKAFGTRPAFRHHFPSIVWAMDASGNPIQDVDLGWVYGPACGEDRRLPPCTPRRRHSGPWSAIRDSLEERQSTFVRRRGGRRAKQVAFDHPAVRQLVAGQAFSFDGVAEWSRCNGRRIGAVLRLQLVRPVSFDGEVPVYANDDTNRVAYLEGVARLHIEGATNFDVYVDLNRRRVVHIGPGITLPGPDDREPPKPKVDLQLIGALKPAGGPDSGDCGKYKD